MQQGRCFEQPTQRPSFDPPDAKHNVCCYPTRDELAPLAECLRGMTTISVGCGAGWVEGLLAREFGLRVVAVEIDVHAAMSPIEAQSRYSSLPAFVSPIVRVRGTSGTHAPSQRSGLTHSSSAEHTCESGQILCRPLDLLTFNNTVLVVAACRPCSAQPPNGGKCFILGEFFLLSSS